MDIEGAGVVEEPSAADAESASGADEG
jgi:hypothetical protein